MTPTAHVPAGTARGLRRGTSLRASLEAANDKAQVQTLNHANEKTLALTTGESLHSDCVWRTCMK